MRPLVFMLLGLLALAAHAQAPEDYQARVPVADESANARGKALREGMKEVIVRVSGDRGAASGTRGKNLLARASQLARTVGYETDPEKGLVLVADFNPTALDAALRENGLPVFGVFAGNVERVSLSLTNITTAGDYARAIAHLRAQPGVRALAVTQTDGVTLELDLQVEGGAGRLAGALSVGGVLARDTQSGGALAYVLRP